ncbi:MAG TPA: hypothetical protein VGE67_13330 [Haloferula sp.]
MRIPAPLLVALASLVLGSCTSSSKLPKLTDQMSLPEVGSESMVEGRRVISGRLLLEGEPRKGDATLKIIGAKGVETRMTWPAREKAPIWIEPGKTYQVELLTTVFSKGTAVYDNVLRISDEGHTYLDFSLCQVHRVPMQRQIEDAKSGCDYPDSFDATRKRQFPNDGNVYLLCGSGISHPLWKCPECEEAYHRWAKRHGID